MIDLTRRSFLASTLRAGVMALFSSRLLEIAEPAHAPHFNLWKTTVSADNTVTFTYKPMFRWSRPSVEQARESLAEAMRTHHVNATVMENGMVQVTDFQGYIGGVGIHERPQDGDSISIQEY